MSRHREKQKKERYPDPRLIESNNPLTDFVAMFAASWVSRRWRDRRRFRRGSSAT